MVECPLLYQFSRLYHIYIIYVYLLCSFGFEHFIEYHQYLFIYTQTKIKQFTYTLQTCYLLTLRFKFQPTIHLSHGLDLPSPTRMPVTTMIVTCLKKGNPERDNLKKSFLQSVTILKPRREGAKCAHKYVCLETFYKSIYRYNA